MCFENGTAYACTVIPVYIDALQLGPKLLPIAREGHVFRSVSVILFTGGGQIPLEADIPPERTWSQTRSYIIHPLLLLLTFSGGQSSSWYASYWNAFLLLNTFAELRPCISPRKR